MTDSTRAWIKDALERLIWTFIQGFAGALILAQTLDLETLEAAALGGLMAALSALKSVAANRLGGETAQMGAKTYSYTEQGPGSAGADMEGGNANLGTVVTVLLIIVLVLLIVRML
jgi:hypothetical protein